MSYMEPAWQITYTLEGRDSEGTLTSWRWEGALASERYELRAPTDGDPASIMGRVAVTSWQPYKKGALDDSHRAALDLCGVVGVSIGGPFVELVLPPVEVRELSGAKGSAGVGISDSASFALTQQLGARDAWFRAVERLAEDPGVRADIDTFLVAKREEDRATRALNLYRIYDRYAQTLIDEEPLLLADAEIATASAGAVSSLSDERSHEDQARVEQAVRNALARVRTRPRLDILHAELADAVEGNPISRDLLRRIDSRRGRVAHNPTVLKEAGADTEADSTLFALVHVLLKRRLGL